MVGVVGVAVGVVDVAVGALVVAVVCLKNRKGVPSTL